MTRREKRRSLFDLFFEDSLLSDVEEIFRRLEEEPLTEGYSINVTQGPEGTKVYVKAGKDIDVASLRRELKDGLALYFKLVLPLLVLAAVVEVFLTPLAVSLLG